MKTNCRPKSHIIMNEQPIEITEFCYLGSTLSCDGIVMKEKQRSDFIKAMQDQF